MKKIDKFILIAIILCFLNSCSGFSDAKKVLKNQKINNSDEFLVKKRDPLILPPGYDKIPKPDTAKKVEDINEEQSSLKKILKKNDTKNTKNKKPSTVEQSIIKSIGK